ncbi:SF1B family DNA helicase RecD2 [Salirhabdus salicampi]|uniref:SF1B family DNA helicase RecD2 n=1 Tax=Salirhabdus salicampi TaxID=476102 RepID=UPI0020C58EA9|nr:ATP-dependent RecD-like DNA helicase [Salirhabdus salicampi]MCP8616964.1 ATP-dependent RecD-like DNA helicase [Salirhabdus salicampi]
MEDFEKEKIDRTYVKGELVRNIFHNADEKFSIALIFVLETNDELESDEIVVKGYFPPLEQNQDYIFYGDMEQHAKFGRQLNVFTYTKDIPETKDSLVRYLSSDLFYGVGKRTAENIVATLGEKAIDLILKDQSVLEHVPNFPKGKMEGFVQALRANQGFERIVMALAEYGIGLQMAQKLFEVYQGNVINQLEDNPYRFVFDIEGFGFRRADEIAKAIGIPPDHPDRIQAGCLHILTKQSQQGDVYVQFETMFGQIKQLLNESDQPLTNEVIQEKVTMLAEEKLLIIENDRVYIPSLYYAEVGLSQQLKRLIDLPVDYQYTEADILKTIGEIEEVEELSYGQEQYEAIEQALQSKVMILTGGPGTGKTTVIKGIINAFFQLNEIPVDEHKDEDRVILCAPTGRAAKRMSEATGQPAQTIHRLLGWTGQQDFEFDQHQQLKGRFIIIDEFSMVDVWLANQLFRAIPNDMQVLLVGDEDQLPSVGPGQVLSDLLSTEKIPFCRLQEIYRQKEGSRIIELAHEMKRGKIDQESLKKGDDFSFIPCSTSNVIPLIVDIVKKGVDKGYTVKDIQVLAPMYRTEVGINSLNDALQQLLNPKTEKKREIQTKDVAYRTGDKVIQLVNQPEKGVFNGDIGEICAIFKAKETTEKTEQIVIEFDGKEVTYARSDLNQIMHAYCISIHKSQGSEFPIVIMPVVSDYRRMLKKNLLYTAVTRSKRSLIICGDERAFIHGSEIEDINIRNTSLIERLQSVFLLDEPTEDTDESVSPYDFM